MRKKVTDRKNDSLKSIVSRRGLLFHEIFNNNITEVDEIVSNQVESRNIHNKLVDVRNQCADFIYDSLVEMTTLVKHGADIKVSSKKKKEYSIKEYNRPCQICGEKRIINLCHIVPRSDGGDNDALNLLLLCPTHHFLFDYARLTKNEFDKISMSSMLDETKAYFLSVHRNRHELRWKYQTNRFAGCDCGSCDFSFAPYREYSSVKVVLKCNKCGEIWLNLWEETHPISKAEITVCDDCENLEDNVRIARLDDAEAKISKFIQDEIPQLIAIDDGLTSQSPDQLQPAASAAR